MKQKVVVIVSGGVVQSVLGSDSKIEVEVIDYDNAESKAETLDLERIEKDYLKKMSPIY